MRSGSAVECAADAQQERSVKTAVVEAKKDRCANDGAPKSPEDSADAPPPHLQEFLREIGAKLRKSPQFHPSSLPFRNY
jgi:hypothetical protein